MKSKSLQKIDDLYSSKIQNKVRKHKGFEILKYFVLKNHLSFCSLSDTFSHSITGPPIK